MRSTLRTAPSPSVLAFTNSAYGKPGRLVEQRVVDALEEVFDRAGHVAEVLGRADHDPSHQRTSSSVVSKRVRTTHLDSFDRVVVGARDHRVGHRLRCRPIASGTRPGAGAGRLDQCSSTKPERSKVRCSRTSPTWSTMMCRRSKRQSWPDAHEVSRYRPLTIGCSGSFGVCWNTTNDRAGRRRARRPRRCRGRRWR